MKRSMKMLLLLAVLAVACGGYFLLDGRQTETATVTEVKGSFDVTAGTAEDVTGLEWTSNDTAWRFTRQDGTWMNADDSAFPVNQSQLTTLAEKLGGLTSTREITDVTDVESYGLSEPDFSVTVQFADSSRVTLTQGDETPFGDGYYAQASDRSGVVYTIESALDSSFDKSLSDLAVKEAIPAADSVTRLTVGSALDISYAEESRTINTAQHWYDTETGAALDTGKVETLLSTVSGLTWNTLEAVSATEEQLAACCLTDETATIVTAYNDQGETALTLYLGDADTSGNTFARLQGSAMIYTLSKANASALTEASADSLWLEEIVAVELADVQQVTFEAEGISYTLAHKTAPSDEGEADTEGDTEGDTEDGEASDIITSLLTDKESSLWQKLTALTAKEPCAESSADGQPILTISILMANAQQAELVFSAHDVDSYLLSMTGHPTVLVSASDVDTLLRILRMAE